MWIMGGFKKNANRKDLCLRSKKKTELNFLWSNEDWRLGECQILAWRMSNVANVLIRRFGYNYKEIKGVVADLHETAQKAPLFFWLKRDDGSWLENNWRRLAPIQKKPSGGAQP